MKFSKAVEFGPQIDVPRLQFFDKGVRCAAGEVADLPMSHR
jgi:hypothetical protein